MARKIPKGVEGKKLGNTDPKKRGRALPRLDRDDYGHERKPVPKGVQGRKLGNTDPKKRGRGK
jgi:hypothetical protein